MILLTNKCLGVRHKNIHIDNFYRSNFNRQIRMILIVTFFYSNNVDDKLSNRFYNNTTSNFDSNK